MFKIILGCKQSTWAKERSMKSVAEYIDFNPEKKNSKQDV